MVSVASDGAESARTAPTAVITTAGTTAQRWERSCAPPDSRWSVAHPIPKAIRAAPVLTGSVAPGRTTSRSTRAAAAPTATASGSVVEPEEGGEQDCGVLWFDAGYDGRWADEVCGAAHAALCETVAYPTW